MPYAALRAYLRRFLGKVTRIRIPERALLGAAMSGALLIAERRLNRIQRQRDA